MGFETRTSRSSGQCLTNWARQESVGQEISEVSFVCFMHHFTCWTLFISRINRTWLYKGHEDSGWQMNVNLAQLVRHWPEDLEVLVSLPTVSNFWRFYFALPCVKICQIIRQKRLSWKTQVSLLEKTTDFIRIQATALQLQLIARLFDTTLSIRMVQYHMCNDLHSQWLCITSGVIIQI